LRHRSGSRLPPTACSICGRSTDPAR
jgi:hypothetical protein